MLNKKHVLWTGGWDSTYRIVELSFEEIEISPIYVIDPQRRSTNLELKAMDKIIHSLQGKEKTKATFLPLIKIPRDSIPENSEISEAYQEFAAKTGLGIQHDWLARLALQYPMMDLCIEKVVSGHMPVREAIMKNGALIKTDSGYVLDKEKSEKNLQLVLGNFTLPIFEKTELDMLADIKAWGYQDVMSLIWFCHSPLNGTPCGVCNPCCTKVDSQMAFLLPPKALRRNKIYTNLKKLFGDGSIAQLYRKIIWRLGRRDK